MFTGIVEELGSLERLADLGDSARLTVRGPRVTSDAGPGDSIAVNGVCLTVVDHADGEFTADVMRVTLRRTALGSLRPGDPVNLERAVTPSSRMGGHVVQGHVDGVGRVLARTPAEHWTVLRIELPADLARYVVPRGSIAVDGVSLTVSACGPAELGSDTGRADTGRADTGRADTGRADTGDNGGDWFEVSLIPTTLSLTTLGSRNPGDPVNLEVDVLAKYVERLLLNRAPHGHQ